MVCHAGREYGAFAMKIGYGCRFALFAALLFGSAGAMQAGPFDDASGYASVGFGSIQGRQITVEDVTGRIGARFGSYLGVEGEVSVGVNQDHFIYAPPCNGMVCPAFEALMKARLGNAEAGYVVGFLPVAANADLFVRAGYGAARYEAQAPFGPGFSQQGVNLGAGAQYFIDGGNGLRFDYTRTGFGNDSPVGREAVGSGANVWSLAYTRQF